MNVSLTPKMEKWIGRKIKQGEYQTASEVVRDALRCLQQREEKLAKLQALIQEGLDDFDTGRYEEVDAIKLKAALRKAIGAAATRKARRVG